MYTRRPRNSSGRKGHLFIFKEKRLIYVYQKVAVKWEYRNLEMYAQQTNSGTSPTTSHLYLILKAQINGIMYLKKKHAHLVFFIIFIIKLLTLINI
jgi:hypothetical protein